ncbi:MAG: glycosyltransferase [Thermodesulfobacteriota bacterium]|nr:glycosyltransferase [Thermodesulfobacteriota bacterium]
MFSPKNSKIMIVTHGLYPVPGHTVSGNGIRAWGLATGLADRGFEVLYATPEDTVHPHTPPKQLTLVPFEDKAAFCRLIDQYQPSVLIVGYWAYMHMIPEDIKIPIVMDLLAPWLLEADFQDNSGMEIEIRDYLTCLSRADFFLCCTMRQKAFHTAWLFAAGFPFKDIPLGVVPISADPNVPPRSFPPAGSEATGSPVVFLYGGVLWPWRSPEQWLTALLEILAREQNGRLQLIGGKYPLDPTGEEYSLNLPSGPEYDAVMEKLDLLPYDRMEDVFLQADIGIELSSGNIEREMSFSFRVIEYLRCGLPVICNDFLEIADKIKLYDAGWVLDRSDEAGLEILVKKILSGQADIAEKSRNAQRLVQEEFNIFKTIHPLARFCRHPEGYSKNKGGLLFQQEPCSPETPAGQPMETCLYRAAERKLKLNIPQLCQHLPVTPEPALLKPGQHPFEYQQQGLDSFLTLYDISGKSILEIGADDAVLLSRFAEKGMALGLGVNNWYWSGRDPKIVRVTENIMISWGDIRSLPVEDESFDIIFTIAAFEHIHELDIALQEMHRILKPGGIIYTCYGPIWSSAEGHHLWFERNGTWFKFSEPETTKPILDNYDHLMYDREEMAEKLSSRWDAAAVQEFLYQIYDNDHINRYMYSDYIRMFQNSLFELIKLENFLDFPITDDIKARLNEKYGSDNDFTCGSLEAVLKKKDVSNVGAEADIPEKRDEKDCQDTGDSAPDESETAAIEGSVRKKMSGGIDMLYRAVVHRLILPLIRRRKKKNLAMITREDLFPVDHGAAAKIYHTARVLSHDYDEVYLITQNREIFYVFTDGRFREERYPRLFKTLLYPGEQKLRTCLENKGIPGPDAFLFYPLRDANFKLRVLYLALQSRIIVFQAEFPAYMAACSWAIRVFGGRTSLVEHNIEYTRIQAAYDLSDHDTAYMKASEIRLCSHADHVITVSDKDTLGLINAGVPAEKITMIPHGVDLENFDAQGESSVSVRDKYGISADDIVLVFHGIFIYPPNREAAEMIGNTILPALNQKGYYPKCLAVGKYPPEQSAHPDLIYTGVADHVAPFIQAADIAVVPLMDGGGTRMKILEYFAAGIPVVATSKGAEGINVSPGRDILIKDSMDEFVDAVIELITHKEKRREIGNAGRRFVEHLDWHMIGKRYVSLYNGHDVQHHSKE